MKKITISTPQLPALLDVCDESFFNDEATLETCKGKGIVFGGSAKALSLDEVILERPILVGAKIEKMTARDLIIRGGDLSACRAWESSLLRSTLHDCRMTGWDINKGICKDVLFEDCKLDMTNFRFTKLTRVTFRRCILTEADFLQAQLHDVLFEDCHIERAEFGQATFKNVDFRSSELINISGWQYFKGVTIDHAQLLSAALYLAQEIGIIVE